MAVLESPNSARNTSRRIPPLENGDRLSRGEFERRYSVMPGVKKAELIEGVVYMPSPVRHRLHAKPHVLLTTWLGYYVSKTPGLEDFGDNGTTRLDEDNEFQPDLTLLLPPHAGSGAQVDEDDYITGPPDWVCEMAASSVSIDLHAKLNVYRRNGVREYLVWQSDAATAQWFTLIEGKYEPLQTGGDGLLKSRLFPGLWLDASALARGDLPRLLAVLDQGTSSPEHAAFVERLKQL